MKKLFFFSIFLLCFQFQQSVFSASWEITDIKVVEKKPTIQSMQNDIKTLEGQKERLKFKWSTFLIWNEKLWSLLRDNLSEEEKKEVEVLITTYVEEKEIFDTKLVKALKYERDTKEIKNSLLKRKHTFYKSLLKYIEVDKLDKFTVYINSDLQFNEKSKIVSIKIDEKSIQRDQRVEEIQEKIDDNSRILRKKIESIMTVKIKKKLDVFVSKEKFNALPNESKIILFNKLIDKIEINHTKLKNAVNPTSFIEEKIVLFEIVEEILYSYIDQWK